MQRNRIPQPSRIKELREQQQLSQRQLAKVLPMDHRTLGRYENGIVQPDAVAIVQIARVFQAPPQEVDPSFNQKLALEIERIERDLRRIEELQGAIARQQQKVLEIQRSVSERQRMLIVCLAG